MTTGYCHAKGVPVSNVETWGQLDEESGRRGGFEHLGHNDSDGEVRAGGPWSIRYRS